MPKIQLHEKYQDQARNICVFCYPDPFLILQETSNFILMFDPFSLVPGHLLMTSRTHYGCLGEVPLDLQQEGSELRQQAISLLHHVFKNPVTRYEHGRAGHCLARDPSARSCHHYHEHLIPVPFSLHSSLVASFKSIPYQVESEVCGLYERYGEYLLVAESDEKKYFYIAKSKKVAPHLLRTLSAEALGYPERQNWENYSSCTIMLEGKLRLEGVVNEVACQQR